MLNAVTKFFTSPEDKDPTFIRLTRNILIFTLVATLLATITSVITAHSRALEITVSTLIVTSLFEFMALLLVLRGKVIMAKAIVPVTLIIGITIIALSTNTIHDISVVAYPVIIIIATLLQGRRSIIVTTPLAVAAIALLGILDMRGLSVSPLRDRTGLDDIIVGIVLILVSTGLLNLLVGRLRTALAKAEANEQAQIDANRELKNLQLS